MATLELARSAELRLRRRPFYLPQLGHIITLNATEDGNIAARNNPHFSSDCEPRHSARGRESVILSGNTMSSLAVWGWNGQLLDIRLRTTEFDAAISTIRALVAGEQQDVESYGGNVDAQAELESVPLMVGPRIERLLAFQGDFSSSPELVADFATPFGRSPCDVTVFWKRDMPDGFKLGDTPCPALAVTAGEDGYVSVFLWDDDASSIQLGPPAVTFSPGTSDEVLAAVGTDDHLIVGGACCVQIHSWDGTMLQRLRTDGTVRSLALSPDEKMLCGGDNGGNVFVTGVSGLLAGQDDPEWNQGIHSDYVRSVSGGSQEEGFVTGSDDSRMFRVPWHATKRAEAVQIAPSCHDNWVLRVCAAQGCFLSAGRDSKWAVNTWGDGGDTTVSAHAGLTGDIHDVKKFRPGETRASIYGIAVNPANGWVATGGRDDAVRIWGGQATITKSARKR
jgi:WD40 repeat protein